MALNGLSIPSEGFAVSTWFYPTSANPVNIFYASNAANLLVSSTNATTSSNEGINLYIIPDGSGNYTINAAVYQAFATTTHGSYFTKIINTSTQYNWHNISWSINSNNGSAYWIIMFDGVPIYNDIAPFNNNDTNNGYPLTGAKQYCYTAYNSFAYYDNFTFYTKSLSVSELYQIYLADNLLKGITGPTGITGITGITGRTGQTGLTGYSGYTGLTGLPGRTGQTGNFGLLGNTGSVSHQGITGNRGYTGQTGFAGQVQTGITGPGITGPTGRTGYTGANQIGPQSTTGVTGNWGNTGTTGISGPSGTTGVTGLTGMKGRTGITGQVGIVGPIGPSANLTMSKTGTTGLTGNTGPQMQVAYTGNTAQPGIIGMSGSIETDGYTGITGLTGITGQTGISDSGITGITGPTGQFGPTGDIVTGNTGYTGTDGYFGTDGLLGYTGVTGYEYQTGYTGIYGITGYTGYYSTGKTGFIGYTGLNEYPIKNIPTIVSFDDDMTYTRQMLSRQMQANSYVTDGALDILAISRGYAQNETVYTFGKSQNITYMATVKIDASYGTIVSNNLKNWSPLTNVSSDAPNRVSWDGTKWIVTRSDASSILYSYNAETFTSTDISGATMSSVANNTQLYVGIGSGGVYYSYDGINWNNSSSGTSLINNTSTAQIGKVVWNGRLWVAVGNGASYAIIYSLNGITWTGVSNSKTIFDIAGGAIDLVWNGTIWVAIGANSDGKLVATSSDGINWSSANMVFI